MKGLIKTGRSREPFCPSARSLPSRSLSTSVVSGQVEVPHPLGGQEALPLLQEFLCGPNRTGSEARSLSELLPSAVQQVGAQGRL